MTRVSALLMGLRAIEETLECGERTAKVHGGVRAKGEDQ